MTKWYAIKTITVKVLLVEVEDGDDPATDAMQVALDESMGAEEFEFEGPMPLTDDDVERWKRHADEVFPLTESA